MAFATNTIEELDKKICQEMNINFEDYKKMTISEKFKIRTKNFQNNTKKK